MVVGWLAHSPVAGRARPALVFRPALRLPRSSTPAAQSAHPADDATSLWPRPHRDRGHAGARARRWPLIGSGILWESGTAPAAHRGAADRRAGRPCGWPLPRVVAKEGLYRYTDPRSPSVCAPSCSTANALACPRRRCVVAGRRGRHRRQPCSASPSSTCWRRRVDGLHDPAHGRRSWPGRRCAELIDTGLDADAGRAPSGQTLRRRRACSACTSCAPRRMAHQALVDAHVQVDARISVSEGHRIAESARARVLRGASGGARCAGAYRSRRTICDPGRCRRAAAVARGCCLKSCSAAGRLASSRSRSCSITSAAGSRSRSCLPTPSSAARRHSGRRSRPVRTPARTTAAIRSISLNCMIAPE
ncbi:MAG: hypothetical protein MZW92_75710 [Comamonadaceae bacterium]|nr:hypothetical protein [Comamonadaceae bacterium]